MWFKAFHWSENKSLCCPGLKTLWSFMFSLCLWLRASLTYINNCPRCNTKQCIYYSASSFYMFRVLPPSNMVKLNLATLVGGSCTKIWPVPEAVVTVLCNPDEGCGWHPKHVEWNCRTINRLFCVASRWTINNIDVMEVVRCWRNCLWRRITGDYVALHVRKPLSEMGNGQVVGHLPWTGESARFRNVNYGLIQRNMF